MKMRLAVLSIPTLLCLMLAVVPAMADSVQYTNGPINGTIGAGNISRDLSVTDSFILSAPTTLTDAEHIGLWTVAAIPLTLDWSITSSAFGGTTFGQGTANLTSTLLFTNSFFYEVYDVSFTFPGVSLAAGTYWFQLQNATSTFLDVYWDQNNGPSMAFCCFAGQPGVPIPSESFTLTGNAGAGNVPEPSSLLLLGTGLIGLGARARKFFQA